MDKKQDKSGKMLAKIWMGAFFYMYTQGMHRENLKKKGDEVLVLKNV